jgi:hypothetical protein
MAALRPTLKTCEPGDKTPCMKNGTAYLLILKAIEPQGGLIHGKLHDAGEHCAIGNYFEAQPKTSLPSGLIDEVAAVNDSVPHATKRQRKLFVMRWLKWKLAMLGMPGYALAKKPDAVK